MEEIMQGCTRPVGGRSYAGYTLLELMVAVGIGALLLTLAIPNFARQLSRADISVQSRELRAALNVARSAALLRQKDVYVCRRSVEGECDISPGHQADWSFGWIVFVDDNGNAALDSADTLLKEVTRQGSNTTVFMNHRGRLRFFPDGSSRSVGFWFCSGTGESRYLALLRTGRSRLVAYDDGERTSECESVSMA
jgi:prepilin-type N-terminal cleavage/methylation domain-containing protein